MVFLVLFLYTASPLLALLGLLQIVFSFPVAMFIYTTIFQIKIFGVLQATAIFLLLGIGAAAPHIYIYMHIYAYMCGVGWV